MSEVTARAEVSVVGGMMSGPDMVPAVLDLVQESDFAIDRYRRVFRAIVDLAERGAPVDEVTVVERLRESGDLEAAGGIADVAMLPTMVPSAANIEYHARIVARNGSRRRMRETAAAIGELAQNAVDTEPEELQAEAERLLAGAAPRVSGTGLVRVRDLLPGMLEHLSEITSKDRAPIGVHSGIRAVDDKLGPMDKGALVLAAGRPSMGKSAFGVCNVAADVAIRQRKAAAIFSVETDTLGVLKRIAGSEARANMAAARRNRDFRDDEYPRLTSIMGQLRDAPLWIDHAGGLTIDQLRVKLRRAVHECGSMDVVVVDYLQMMTHPKAKSRYEEVSFIGAGLKRIATEFETVVVALSQLSRAVEQRPDKRPMMSDLRESGTLEQDADVILLLYRPEYYHGPTIKVKREKETQEINVEGKAEIIIAKVRDGETGSALVGFEKEYTHFYDLNHR